MLAAQLLVLRIRVALLGRLARLTRLARLARVGDKTMKDLAVIVFVGSLASMLTACMDNPSTPAKRAASILPANDSAAAAAARTAANTAAATVNPASTTNTGSAAQGDGSFTLFAIEDVTASVNRQVAVGVSGIIEG